MIFPFVPHLLHYPLPVFTLHYYLNTSGMLQPQGLYTCYSLCLDGLFPDIYTASSFTFFRSLLKNHLSEIFPATISKISTSSLFFLSSLMYFLLFGWVFFPSIFILTDYMFHFFSFFTITISTRNVSSVKAGILSAWSLLNTVFMTLALK